MSRPEDADAVRYGSRYASTASGVTIGACPMCAAPLPSRRATYCSVACKQLAFRLRRQRSAAPNVALVRQQLKRQRLLAAARAAASAPWVSNGARRASCSAEPWDWEAAVQTATP